mgnify:CR=1 FL=1
MIKSKAVPVVPGHGPLRRTLTALALLLALTPAHARLPLELADGEPLPSLAPMLDKTTPAVVNVATYTTVQVRNRLLEDPFFRRFFSVPDSRRYRRTQSAGSGVVVDADTVERFGGVALWAFGGMALAGTPQQKRLG